MSDLDIEGMRAMTPGCANRNHLNNAGAALLSTVTIAAMTDYLRREALIGGYEAEAEAADQIGATYESLAELIGVLPTQIALFDNSTHAWNAACYSVPLGAGDRILTGRNEYGSAVLAYLQLAQRTGAEVVVVPDDDSGQIDVAALADLVDERTRMIGLTWVPTAGGLVNPAAEVGATRAGRRRAVPARRHPGRRPVPDRRLGNRLRHARRHRPQVSSWPAGYRFPLRGTAGARSARPVRRRDPFRHLGRRTFVHMGGWGAALRDMGEQLRQRRWPGRRGPPGHRRRPGPGRQAQRRTRCAAAR